MFKNLLIGGLVLGAIAVISAPARATINPEAFTDPGYVAGNPLSAFFWDVGDDTTGVLDIEEIGGNHQRVVKMTANGPDPGPPFPSINGQAGDTVGGGWGGPGREGGVAGPLWFRVDIQKGTGDASTSLTDFIWGLSFTRPNGANIFSLDGGLTTIRFKSSQNGYTGPTFNLNDGWNQVIVLNDNSIPSTDPNTFVYLNGVLLESFTPSGGALLSNTTNTGSVSLVRQSRGGDGDHFVGTMRFDNFFTANETLFPMPDVNMDTFVDIFDVNEISANWDVVGAPYSVSGDANKDGIVDIFDVNLVSANWAPPPSAGGASAVPEPATWLMLGLGLMGLAALGRRSSGR